MLRLKMLRNKYKIKQIHLAQKLNVSNTTISNWEHNHRYPDLDSLIKISNIFNVSVDYLLGRENKEETFQELNINQLKEIIFKILSIPNEDLYKINNFLDKLINEIEKKNMEIKNNNFN